MSKFILSAFADEIDPDLTTQMDVLDKHDIKYIEIRGVNGKNIIHRSLAEVKEIKKQLDSRGFKVSSIGSPIGKIKITDKFKPHLDLFKHTLEIADVLETGYVRMFSFFIPDSDDPGSYRDEVMDRWSIFIGEAKGSNLFLLHENEKDIYGNTPERCLDLIMTMNCSYFKAVFDPANFVQCDVITYPHAYECLKDHIAYMHIKDALYKDHSVVPSGYGDGKVKEILIALSNKNFEGFLSLEPHLGSFQGYAELEDPNRYSLLPPGGIKAFSAAAEALEKILSEIAYG
jgi:sugar phosphate isomerase/epimerase